ncbi:tripartite tricarboxylate transporter substrate binding protein [Aurantimonas sp. C2-6-R+9]|uniref:Bug family tripartite tricarboxylate transporter substrate binding protein n=1 Tax=unclassified Aurantimonas TaxID=2638230 RepID=UPI002E19A0AF|nr:MULTISPECIES: tripartite tricarboxylate transporter substrate binding protein [unclassified Aurantimonas]MEC5292433.1 tripartite tricarboxylate transporter substrate binding protein [Aurantimonas sp. C2-3-R2]MEC5382978.1 tripartite tricarboxylate transporter substrate binding protein [Aurantimonas sp. C2-6-R+9]MEC5413485.1 tripartite tricarboxylate transporter substrate binding protein [Aurantimonas sp. C2-4-R8]
MKRLIQTFSAGLVAAAMAIPTMAAAQDAWPDRPITFVVGFGVGGSADRTARALAQFMPEELGQPISVVNRDGAGGQLAASYVLAQPADGYTILATSVSPYLANSIIHTEASYSIDDFAFVNGQWSDWDIIAVNKDRDIHSLAEMIEAIKENPGKMSVSVVPSSAGQLSAYLLLEAAGLTDSDLNIVTYESGGAARAAVAGGQVDFTILGGEGSEGIRDMITPLAVVRDEPAPEWDAPTVAEALKEIGLEMPVVSGSIRGLATDAEFKEKYPERWDKLVAAYKATLEKPEVKKYLEENSIGGEWLGPEKTTEVVNRNYEVIKKYKDLMGN